MIEEIKKICIDDSMINDRNYFIDIPIKKMFSESWDRDMYAYVSIYKESGSMDLVIQTEDHYKKLKEMALKKLGSIGFELDTTQRDTLGMSGIYSSIKRK